MFVIIQGIFAEVFQNFDDSLGHSHQGQPAYGGCRIITSLRDSCGRGSSREIYFTTYSTLFCKYREPDLANMTTADCRAVQCDQLGRTVC